MAAPSQQLRYQGEALQQLVAGVQADQWDNPTPCAKWTVRDLAGHIVGGGTMFAASFRGDAPQEGDPGDLLGDDPAGALAKVFSDFEAAADSPGAMDRDIVLPFATLPAQVALDVAKFDLLVHAWDLAQATGQSFDPPADVVENARATAAGMVDGIRDGDTFGDAAEAPAGASPIDELAAFCGRSV